jgi:predicted nucleic acid-binding protein
MTDTLADTGFIYALFDASDKKHLACIQVMQMPRQRVYLPGVTLPEVAHFVKRNIGGQM